MLSTRRIATALLAGALAAPALAAQAPSSGWRAEFLGIYAGDEAKYVQLAEATPWEKYAYRPGAGVRSTCEVFLHISGANFGLASSIGAKPPAGVDMKNIEKCPDGKAKVLATLKASFVHFKAAVVAMPDNAGDEKIKLFGQEMTKRGFLTFIAEHTGEHLGQSIAYARANGIVPPWSAKPGM
jgi:uncharacterized damage-inducible protein DinB